MSIDVFHRLIVAAQDGLTDVQGFTKRINDERKARQMDEITPDAVEQDNAARAIAIYNVCIASDVLRTWDAHDTISAIRALRNACPDADSDLYKELSRIHSIAKSILDQVGRNHLSRIGGL